MCTKHVIRSKNRSHRWVHFQWSVICSRSKRKTHPLVRWCSWLSRQSNTLKVLRSSLSRIILKSFFAVFHCHAGGLFCIWKRCSHFFSSFCSFSPPRQTLLVLALVEPFTLPYSLLTSFVLWGSLLSFAYVGLHIRVNQNNIISFTISCSWHGTVLTVFCFASSLPWLP